MVSLEFRLQDVLSHIVFPHDSGVQGIWKTHLALLCLEDFKTHLDFSLEDFWFLSHCNPSTGWGTSLPRVFIYFLLNLPI